MLVARISPAVPEPAVPTPTELNCEFCEVLVNVAAEPDAFPVRAAVIVPALKLPEASRATNVDAVFAVATPVPVAKPVIAGVVIAGEVIVCTPVKVFAASVRATVKDASGRAMERAAVGPVNVICCPKIGNVLLAFGSVTTVAVPATAAGRTVASPEVLPNIFTDPSVVTFAPRVT